jgi:uncharacterized membrane protein YphA (DoxX/SURF4 family)
MDGEDRAGRARRLAGHAGRLGLGLVFLLAALAKAADPSEFAFEMAGYGIVGSAVAALSAPLLIAFEAALGAALLCSVLPRAASAAAIVVLVGFLGVKGWALGHGRTDPCGCFGTYLQTGPAAGFAIDLVFLALAILTFWGLRPRRGEVRPGAFLFLGLVAALALGLTLASPRLPIDSLVTGLVPGKTLRDLGIASKVPAEGRYLVALLDVTDPSTTALSSHLDALKGERMPSVVALTPASEEEKAAFLLAAGPSYDLERVDRPVLKRLYRRLPRFFLVASGRVVAVYGATVPEAADLLSSGTP